MSEAKIAQLTHLHLVQWIVEDLHILLSMNKECA